MDEEKNIVREKTHNERLEILERLENWLETPMLVLSFVWLALFIYESIWGISPLLDAIGNVIWIIFIVDFAVKFMLAPDKTDYLKNNWLTAIALLLPALRVFRAFRAFRLLRAAPRLAFCASADISKSRNEGSGREFQPARFRLRGFTERNCFVLRRGGNVCF